MPNDNLEIVEIDQTPGLKSFLLNEGGCEKTKTRVFVEDLDGCLKEIDRKCIRDPEKPENAEIKRAPLVEAARRLRDPIREALGFPGNTKVKVRADSQAGCSCGCSPGFVVDGDTEFREVCIKVRDPNNN